MGLDWERLSLSGYLEAREAHFAAESADGKKGGGGSDGKQLAAVMAARQGL